MAGFGSFGPNFMHGMMNVERSRWSGMAGPAGSYVGGKGAFGTNDSLKKLKDSVRIGMRMWTGKTSAGLAGTGSGAEPEQDGEPEEKPWKETAESSKEVPAQPVFTSGDQISAAQSKQQECTAGSAAQLQQAMLWSEILGEPVSVKRRKKRVERAYGNQGHARRG